MNKSRNIPGQLLIVRSFLDNARHQNRRMNEKRTGKKDADMEEVLNQRLQSLLSIASALTSELDFDRLFPLVVGKISEAMEAERTSLYVIDWEKQTLWTRVSEGIEPLTLKIGEGIGGHVAETGDIVCVDDAWTLPYYNREYDARNRFRTRSVLCMPIYNHEGERFAVIEVINKKNRVAFDENDKTFLEGLGAQVGIALENALLYEEIRLSFESFIRTLSANRSEIRLDPPNMLKSFNIFAISFHIV